MKERVFIVPIHLSMNMGSGVWFPYATRIRQSFNSAGLGPGDADGGTWR
jgi:hypothetical protein